jgi:hypothetical protein
MAVRIESPGIYLWIIRAISLLVPQACRFDWRREWEAEVCSRWLLLKKWERLNAHSKLDLFRRVQGALVDVLSFQRRRTSLMLGPLNIVVALLVGFGACQEFIFRCIVDPQLQPILVSLFGIAVSILFAISGIAMLRHWPTVRGLIMGTGILSILFHVYGALPPHRSMGYPALIVGAGYGLVMLVLFERTGKRSLVL